MSGGEFLPPADVLNRFWSSVDQRSHDDCWPWQRSVNRWGYGRFSYNYRKFHASRFALMASSRSLGRGLMALHSCDNPVCCNPKHLRWGTNADNVRDAVQRGRCYRWNGRRKGEANPVAKLTQHQADAIRADSRPARVLAEEHGVSATTIWNVRHERHYSHG